ncbi:MAG: hypothetical protein ACKO2F_02150 [Cyanobacteriota bacterium]
MADLFAQSIATVPTIATAAALAQKLASGALIDDLRRSFETATGLSGAIFADPILTTALKARATSFSAGLAALWSGPRPSSLTIGTTTYATTWSAASTAVGLQLPARRTLSGDQLHKAAGPKAPVVGLWQPGELRGDGASQVLFGAGLVAGQVMTEPSRTELGGGADALLGHGLGVGVVNRGQVDLGACADRVLGTAFFTGVVNTGRLRLDGDLPVATKGSQDDEVIGVGAFTGIANFGRIDASLGSDRLLGASAGLAVFNAAAATIDLGAGLDVVAGGGLGLAMQAMADGGRASTGLPEDLLKTLRSALTPYATELAPEGGLVNQGTLDTGADGDIVFAVGSMAADTPETKAIRGFMAQFGPYDGVALVNGAGARLRTGDGDDIVLALGAGAATPSRPPAVANDGEIDLGNGRDVLLAPDGFTGRGVVKLGDGDDTLLGFGSGRFEFGNGADALGLLAGSYRLRRGERQSIDITRQGDSAVMRTWNLETINGVRIGSLLARPDGAFTVGTGTGQVPLPSDSTFDIAARTADLNALLR